MRGTITSGATSIPADREGIEAALSAHTFFWLDLDGIDDEATDVLLNTFSIHPLAVKDVEHFGQRPKVDEYDGFVHMVVHGVSESGSPVDEGPTDEVHFIFATDYAITIHRGSCGALDDARQRVGEHRQSQSVPPQIDLIYLIIDRLVDSFFDPLEKFDNQIDDLEDAILVRPTEAQLGTLFSMKRSLIGFRRVITPQRDMFGGVAAGVTELPGITDDALRYFRDIYDHLIRLSDIVDGYRDLLSGVMDTHLSTVSNRLNVVMKQLTIIATVFLPLSFLTGFFGQNFGWLVTRLTGFWAFLILAVGLEVVAAAALLYMFRRRGWLGGDST